MTISRRLSVWQKVVALAPLLLLAVSLPGQVLLRCQMDGNLRSSCCCPSEKGNSSPVPVLKSQDCCQQEVSVNEPAAAEAGRATGADFVAIAMLPPLAPVTLAIDADDAGGAGPMPYLHGPPTNRPSIVLLKQAFLI